jgi:hypothetical protein
MKLNKIKQERTDIGYWWRTSTTSWKLGSIGIHLDLLEEQEEKIYFST